MTIPTAQTVPVQLHRADQLLVLAAPMPGLEPPDITVVIDGDRVIIDGTYRGSRQDQPDVLVSEWTMGPYHRDIILPQLVNGGLTNATYGNGVLVLAMPVLLPGTPGEKTEFRLDAITGTRGQHVSHTGGSLAVTDPGAPHHGVRGFDQRDAR
jgi:HSP20 family protein